MHPARTVPQVGGSHLGAASMVPAGVDGDTSIFIADQFARDESTQRRKLTLSEYDRESHRFVVHLLDGKNGAGNAVFTNCNRP